MKIRLYPLALPVMLALAACRPGAAEYTEAEAPKLLRMDSAAARFPLTFAAGSSQLAPGERDRLDHLALSGSISPEDRVTISLSGDPLLREKRAAAISRELLRFGIAAAASPLAGAPRDRAIVGLRHGVADLEIGADAANPLAGAPRDRAIIAVERYMITLPACPNWSKPPSADFTNTSSSNFGCATASNLGLMVASPADLVSGRALEPVDAKQAMKALQAYEAGKIAPPPAAPSIPTTTTASGTTGQ